MFSVGNKKFIGGFTQRQNNQDAYIICEENGTIRWSRYYDTSPDDSRAEALTADVHYLYAAFSCTGGNTSFRATEGAFQGSYGSGGGPKIVYLARIESQSGGILNATFIGCKPTNGKTNTLRTEDGNPAPIRILSTNLIEFKATKAFDRADGRLTPDIGPDVDCEVSGGGWTGVFDQQLQLVQGDCTE